MTFNSTTTERRRMAPVPSAAAPRVLVLLGIVLALYAAFGKGFAYAGVPPVFVGEITLAFVLLSVVGPTMPLPRSLPAGLTLGLFGVAIVQLVVDRMNAVDPLLESVRGLAPIYYCTFAFATFALLRTYERRAGRLAVGVAVDRWVSRAAPFVLAAVTMLAGLLLIDPGWLPVWPTSGRVMLASKSGDIAVVLVLLFAYLDLARDRQRVGPPLAALFAMWGFAGLCVTFRSRGALLALIAGLLVMRPNLTRMVKGAIAATTVALMLYITGLTVEVRGREISYDAIGDAVASMLNTVPEDEIGGSYVGTVNWRTDWWSDIWYDVNAEPMIFHGHGWGDNLKARYLGGPQSTGAGDERVLRLPHNIFLSLAGRAGLVVAVGFLLVPILTVARTFGNRDPTAPKRAVHAARGAIAAAIVTGLFDVYLESPQGGILFWSLIGFLWWATAPSLDNVPKASCDRVVEPT